MSPAALEARGLGRRHPTALGWLLRDVSLDVRAGDRLAVLGPTGAGKTLLLRALALLDPVDEGTIRWRGAAVRRDAIPAFRSRVVYLHQRPALFAGTVEENLRAPFQLRAHGQRRFDREQLLERIEWLGRDRSFLAKPLRELSGGESQLVAVLRALQLDPAILLLDEPTAALDAATSRAIEHLVSGWFEERPGERASAWVSHDHEQARRVADRVIFVKDGRLESEAAT
jgi:putative ABC transport system ATP-binding protein